ncbi:MAG: TIR domain-containing protein [Pseudomonadota bacterium]
MPFLDPPFKNDIFVSYAHGGGNRLKHWSACLASELRSQFLDLTTDFDDLKIFIDKQLDPAMPLTDQLRGQVQASGLLLIIMSNRYLQSSWCNNELEWFDNEIRQCQAEGGVILVVRAQPTDHEVWPTCLKDDRGFVVLGFQFHPDDQSSEEMAVPYGWPEPQPSDRPYFRELANLATKVMGRLKQIKEKQALETQASAPRVRAAVEGSPCVYLQARPDEAPTWQAAKRALEDLGCTVLPEALPQRVQDLKALQIARKARIEMLRDQAHALCLLRTAQLAHGVDLDIESIANDRISLQVAGKEMPCAILNQSSESVPHAADLGIDVVEAQRDDWPAQFQAWLASALTSGPIE